MAGKVPDKGKKLNTMQQLFVLEYLKDFNCTQAAIRAGYSKRSAGQIGSALLMKHEISDAVFTAQKQLQDEIKIDAAWVLRQAALVHNRCMQAAPVYDRKGHQVITEDADGEPALAFTFDAAGANKALEIIGKHVTVKAFADEPDDKQPAIGTQINQQYNIQVMAEKSKD